ncbi:hypothetical protein KJ591_01550 [Patescibacteria group bacterium]|nr:hypothetical protein [Patescibacteria group bacterium]MBU4023031.1 hypothetical protein [Patescibacteria group bacterium]
MKLNLSKTLEKDIPKIIADYLSPDNGERAHAAFQFTINGVTYPFVRNLNFAALPDPPRQRRYSMLGALFLARPGDLMFFYQSDPQWRKDDIDSRRGLRGIYVVSSAPFRGTDNIKDPTTGYTMLGNCPNCHISRSTLSAKCPKCRKEYPTVNLQSRSDPYHNLLLSLRIEIEPLIVFERAISDERAYADMSDTGMIWIGRHDNQMGAGKGSSVRQLLPEEAIKITRMMLSEPGQKISFPQKVDYKFEKKEILNEDGTKVTDLELRPVNQTIKIVAQEHMLNFDIARSIDNPNSSFVKELGNEFGINEMEYVSSEFPWGYTAGESDFIVAFKNETGRYKVFVMEFKRDWIDDATMIQVSLYNRWVVQTICQFATPKIENITVYPIVVGRRLKKDTVRPRPYSFTASYNSGVSVKADVKSPQFIDYTPEDEFTKGGIIYAASLKYKNKSIGIPQIDWIPEQGIITSQVERDWVINTSWVIAKKKTKSS